MAQRVNLSQTGLPVRKKTFVAKPSTAQSWENIVAASGSWEGSQPVAGTWETQPSSDDTWVELEDV